MLWFERPKHGTELALQHLLWTPLLGAISNNNKLKGSFVLLLTSSFYQIHHQREVCAYMHTCILLQTLFRWTLNNSIQYDWMNKIFRDQFQCLSLFCSSNKYRSLAEAALTMKKNYCVEGGAIFFLPSPNW